MPSWEWELCGRGIVCTLRFVDESTEELNEVDPVFVSEGAECIDRTERSEWEWASWIVLVS